MTAALRRAWLSLRRSWLFWQYHRLNLRVASATRLYHATAMEHVRDALVAQCRRDEARLAKLVERISREPLQ